VPTKGTATTSPPEYLSIAWAPGDTRRYHWIWLRDSCPCPQCRNSHAKQKYFDSATLPADIRPTAVRQAAEGVHITWPDGHESQYSAAWLREHATPDTAPVADEHATGDWLPWPDAAGEGTFPAESVMAQDDVLGRALRYLFRYGLIVISGKDFPGADPDLLCERLAGFADRSYFGEFFDLEVKPEATTDSVSFSTRHLPLHTDIPYYSTPPDVQFLFGLDVNATATASRSGRTRFVDGFSAAQVLRDTDPAAFELLSTTKVLYRAEYPNARKIYQSETSVIVLDEDGRITRLVNNPTKMFFDNVPFDQVSGLYRAYRVFKDLMEQDSRAYHHSWHQGDMVVFDNRRIFHGRGRFDEPGLRRKLRGGYFSLVELCARARFVGERSPRG
jgi:gamma-butyrobetaine dioxygenase